MPVLCFHTSGEILKPPYSLKNNFFYALNGLRIVSKENAFKIEFAFFCFFTVVLIFLPYPVWSKIILLSSLFFPLVAEIFNTAIENVVDLCTDEYNILAKQAKDLAALGVLFSIILTALVWIGVIFHFSF
mgnify:CR=1 FL=1